MRLPSKIVIRRLPPELTEEDFKSIVDPIPQYQYFRFCKPDLSLGVDGKARAYIDFLDPDIVFDFKERFDQYVFVDKKGNESAAVIEYAPYQGPIKKKEKTDKVDHKQGTIWNEPMYLEFVEGIGENNKEKSATESKTPCEAILEEIQTRESVTTEMTPLVAFLNSRGEVKHSKDNVVSVLKADKCKRSQQKMSAAADWQRSTGGFIDKTVSVSSKRDHVETKAEKRHVKKHQYQQDLQSTEYKRHPEDRKPKKEDVGIQRPLCSSRTSGSYRSEEGYSRTHKEFSSKSTRNLPDSVTYRSTTASSKVRSSTDRTVASDSGNVSGETTSHPGQIESMVHDEERFENKSSVKYRLDRGSRSSAVSSSNDAFRDATGKSSRSSKPREKGRTKIETRPMNPNMNEVDYRDQGEERVKPKSYRSDAKLTSTDGVRDRDKMPQKERENRYITSSKRKGTGEAVELRGGGEFHDSERRTRRRDPDRASGGVGMESPLSTARDGHRADVHKPPSSTGTPQRRHRPGTGQESHELGSTDLRHWDTSASAYSSASGGGSGDGGCRNRGNAQGRREPRPSAGDDRQLRDGPALSLSTSQSTTGGVPRGSAGGQTRRDAHFSTTSSATEEEPRRAIVHAGESRFYVPRSATKPLAAGRPAAPSVLTAVGKVRPNSTSKGEAAVRDEHRAPGSTRKHKPPPGD